MNQQLHDHVLNIIAQKQDSYIRAKLSDQSELADQLFEEINKLYNFVFYSQGEK